MKRIVWMAAAAVVVSAVAVTAQQQSKSQRAKTKISTHGGARAAPRGASEAVCRTAGRLRKAHGLDHPVAISSSTLREYAVSRRSRAPVDQSHFHGRVWTASVDAFLHRAAAFSGYYRCSTTCRSVEGYRAEQTNEGWTVTFSTTLFSANDYTFTFDIYSSSGGANLTISSVWYNPVQYSGTITQVRLIPPFGT